MWGLTSHGPPRQKENSKPTAFREEQQGGAMRRQDEQVQAGSVAGYVGSKGAMAKMPWQQLAPKDTHARIALIILQIS